MRTSDTPALAFVLVVMLACAEATSMSLGEHDFVKCSVVVSSDLIVVRIGVHAKAIKSLM